MDLDFFSRFLLWSLAVNYAILMTWFLAFVFAHRFMKNLHGRWFSIPGPTFDAIHYGGMAAYKLAIFFLNLVPFLALSIARGSA